MPLSEDEVSLSDDEFGVPEDPIEQVRFQRRLMATARSLKKKQQQLQADQDLLTDRWTKVLAAEEYRLDRPTKGYTKHNLLPQPEKEVLKPTPRRQYITVRGNTQETRGSIHKPRRNRHKRHKNNDDDQDKGVGAEFRDPQSGQRKENSSGPSGPSSILDQPCQIHGTPRMAAKHTNRECQILKTKWPAMRRKQ